MSAMGRMGATDIKRCPTARDYTGPDRAVPSWNNQPTLLLRVTEVSSHRASGPVTPGCSFAVVLTFGARYATARVHLALGGAQAVTWPLAARAQQPERMRSDRRAYANPWPRTMRIKQLMWDRIGRLDPRFP